MPFKHIIILAKEQTPGTEVTGDQISTVYLAKKIPGEFHMNAFKHADVVQVDLENKIASDINVMQKYFKLNYPVFINQEIENIEMLEERVLNLPNTEKDKIKKLSEEPIIPLDPQQLEFLKLTMLDLKNYDEVAGKLEIDRAVFRDWWQQLSPNRKKMAKARQLYNSRKDNEDFKPYWKDEAREFYDWYINQPARCYYCRSEEYKLKALFDKNNPKGLTTKRTRGASLELERIDSSSNQYSPGNTTLACYFCNNHKSDIISAEDHLQFFARPVAAYIDKKYNELEIEYVF